MIPLSKTERGHSSSIHVLQSNKKIIKPSTISNERTHIVSHRVNIFNRNCKILFFNVFLSAIHTALAFLTLILTKNWNLAAPLFSFRIAVNYTADHASNIEMIQQRNFSSISDVFAPRLLPLKSGLPIAWLTFAFFAITAFFHFGSGILWYQYYLHNLDNKFNWVRWVEYSITASLMWLVIAQSFAFIEITQLVLSTLMIAITMASGITVDWIARPDPEKDEWSLPLSTRLVFLLPGVFLYGCASLTLLLSMIYAVEGDLPSFVLPTVIVVLGLFECFAIVLIVQQLRPPSKWIYGEYWYLALSLISKATLGITLMINVLVYEQYACIFDAMSC